MIKDYFGQDLQEDLFDDFTKQPSKLLVGH